MTRQFVKFCTLLGLDTLATDPRYLSNASRVKHRDTLTPELTARTVNFDRDTLLSMLEAAGVPGGPINSVADVFADPQIIHREMRVDTPHTGSASGTAPGVRSPLMFSDAELALERGAPRLGEHTHEVLAEIGMKP
jgi:crotonobetainyl-CoA:carnitine CoA-transferase CaiB-like acyl-CoA transferase